MNGAVKILASKTLSAVFSKMKSEIEVKSAAVRSQGSGYRCIHALNATKSESLTFNNKRGPLRFTGNSMVAPDCVVQVNSSAYGAVFVKESEGYEFARHCFVGGVRGVSAALVPPPDPTCKQSVPDGFASRVFPSAPGSCMPGSISVSGNTASINPGTFCSGVSVSQANIVLKPGIYHIKGGNFSLSATQSIVGDGVTIIMHPGAGEIEMVSDAVLRLQATKTGATAGFIIIDRTSSSNDHLLKTTDNDVAFMEIDGIIYTPADHFELFWKRAGVGENEKPLRWRNFGLVADTIDLHGYNQVFIETPDPATIAPELLAAGGAGGKVRLVR